MDRRSILRTMFLTACAMALGKYDALGQKGGALLVPLSQWKWLRVQYGGREIAIPVSEVFAALDEAYGSTPIKGEQ